MGRIIGYQYDDNVQDGDAWIGSEDGGGRTKQYTAEAVANYLNIQGKISIVGQMTYKYGITPLSGPGTFAVFGGGTDPVAFSAITKLTLSNTDVSKQRVVEFLNLLVGSDILISKQSAISTFGYYSIDNYAVNATDPAYYDLGVTFKSGNGSMEAEQIYETQNFTLAAEENISTLQTTIDSGNTYQATPSAALWTWGASAITVASTSFTSLLSSKRFKTTLIADGSYTDVLPNQLIFNNALGNETSITPNTALSSDIDLQWPSSSGTLALTTDITDSPWDTVSEGINYAGGNVGIGTTTPLAKLQVFGGSAIIGDDDFNAVKISANGSGTTYNTIGNGFIAPNVNFNINNQTKLTINGNSGNVGIGTTSPNAKLEVNGGEIRTTRENVPANYLSLSTTSAGSFIKNAGGTSKGLTFDNVSATSPYINFKLLSSEAMRITSAGNVGVGTTSPSAPLDVATISSGPVAKFVNTSGTGGAGVVIQAGVATSSSILTLFDYQNNERLRVRGDGNVGIGTTSPSEKLDVAGNIELGDGGTGAALKYNSTNRGTIFVNGSEIMRLEAAGNVGIGTTSPQSKLNINGGTGSLSTGLTFGDGDTGIWEASDDNLRFSTTSTTRMVINSSGNVGIGTTSPSAKLEVVDSGTNTNINSRKDLSTTAFTSTYNAIQMSNFDTTANNWAKFSFAGNSGIPTQTAASIATQFLDHTNNYGDLTFWTRGSVDFDERMRITSTGNVGIGTTSPLSRLHVVSGEIGNGANKGIRIEGHNGTKDYSIRTGVSGIENTSLAFYDETAGANRIVITSAGNVGIGATSPGYKLEVDNSANAANNYIAVISNNSNNSGVLFRDAGGNRGLIFANPDNDLVFMANGTSEKMRINASGNVGIGTTSPSQKLEVNGNVLINGAAPYISIKTTQTGTPDWKIYNSYNTVGDFAIVGGSSVNNKFNIQPNGNVGIGTTSPAYKLDVTGSARIDGVLRVGTTAQNGEIKIIDSNGKTFSLNSGNVGNNKFAIEESGTNVRYLVIDGTTSNVGIGVTAPSQKLEVDGQVLSDGYRLAAMQTAPATRNSTGTLGEIVIDGNHIYVCYATDSWSRVALDTSW